MIFIAIFVVGFVVLRGQTPASDLPKTTLPQQVVLPGQNDTLLPLTLPDNYKISLFSSNLGNPRDLEFDPSGSLVATITSAGRVVAFDNNGEVKTILSNLNQPHGIAFDCTDSCKLFVAETNQVSTFDYDPTTKTATNKQKIIDLPSGGGHFTRSILIKEDKLYTSIGSTCNVCLESDPRRASIYWSNLDGSEFESFAVGLRNSVFMSISPKGDILATEMGRDNLGDDLPPDEINIIKQGDFGWPICYGKNIFDPTVAKESSSIPCRDKIPSQIDLQAHSAPLGLSFISYNQLLVAYHGSWNRSIPTGYKIVKITLDDNNNATSVEDFITGFIQDAEVLGRPADIITRGEISFISDDKLGNIYKLEKLN